MITSIHSIHISHGEELCDGRSWRTGLCSQLPFSMTSPRDHRCHESPCFSLLTYSFKLSMYPLNCRTGYCVSMVQCNAICSEYKAGYWDLGRRWVWNLWSVVNLWTFLSDLINKNWNDEIIFNSNWKVILDISWELYLDLLGDQTLLLQDIDPLWY